MNAIIGLGEHATGQATYEDLFAHIDHIARVAGMQTIGLGPDYLATTRPSSNPPISQA